MLINYNDSHWTFAMFINGIYKTQSGFVVPKDKVNKFYYIAQVVQAIQEQEAISINRLKTRPDEVRKHNKAPQR